MAWVWVTGGVLLVGGMAWYLLIETEGVYLGRRVVIWLYDRFAGRYDAIKVFDARDEHMLLAVPLLAACAPQKDPLILDIATGTARLPLALCNVPQYQGNAVGVDLSRAMLSIGAEKLAEDLARVDLLHCPAECLPFPDDTFDAVTCLEALEFTTEPTQTLREALRVLRPGGVLLATLRQNVHTLPGKLWTREQMHAALTDAGATGITFEEWQHEYLKVWARKLGDAHPTGATPLEDILRCPACAAVAFGYEPPQFICGECGVKIPVGEDGVLEATTVQRC